MTGRWRIGGALLVGISAAACFRDTRGLGTPSAGRALHPSGIGTRTWPLCTLIGDGREPGAYGTDLGYTAKRPGSDGRLAVFFGDTWANAGTTCPYPVLGSDDLLASLPAERPAALQPEVPSRASSEACGSLAIGRRDPGDPTSWDRVRLFASLDGEDGARLDTDALRTPVAAFSTGEALFTLYHLDEPVACVRAHGCPDGMMCSVGASDRSRRVGVCAGPKAPRSEARPAYCRDVTDCGPGLECRMDGHGVCLAVSTGARAAFSPTWERDDPRTLIARTIYVAANADLRRPEKFSVVHRFSTNRFVNVAARTIAYFDPEHPERNDYRPGTHTLLLFGRQAFFGTAGAQALPFLLYVRLEGLRGDLHGVRWDPRFFSGYDESGKPRWSGRESEAVPIYGTETREGDGRKEWVEPEFDYVNQMTVSYVQPLGRFVMLYGGDLPAFMVKTPRTGETPKIMHPAPVPGAIHLRTSSHPWGRLLNDPGRYAGWSSPEPVLTREQAAPYLACPDEGEASLPGCLPRSKTAPGGPAASPQCIAGAVVLAGQSAVSGNQIGRLYGANVIDEWTQDVSAQAPGLDAGERAAEIYWNVSTWNPYRVVLVKTELREKTTAPEPVSKPRSGLGP